jgi:hypothetical protein
MGGTAVKHSRMRAKHKGLFVPEKGLLKTTGTKNPRKSLSLLRGDMRK